MGFQAAMDVSLNGLKKSVSSNGFTQSGNPVDDFLPKNVTGSASSSPGGPFLSAEVGKLKIL